MRSCNSFFADGDTNKKGSLTLFSTLFLMILNGVENALAKNIILVASALLCLITTRPLYFEMQNTSN